MGWRWGGDPHFFLHISLSWVKNKTTYRSSASDVAGSGRLSLEGQKNKTDQKSMKLTTSLAPARQSEVLAGQRLTDIQNDVGINAYCILSYLFI